MKNTINIQWDICTALQCDIGHIFLGKSVICSQNLHNALWAPIKCNNKGIVTNSFESCIRHIELPTDSGKSGFSGWNICYIRINILHTYMICSILSIPKIIIK